MVESSTSWPKQGPGSYFPSIEKKYGRSIAEWQEVIRDCGFDKHMAIVGHLKSEYEWVMDMRMRSSGGRSLATSQGGRQTFRTCSNKSQGRITAAL